MTFPAWAEHVSPPRARVAGLSRRRAGQRLRVGRTHAGKDVIIIAEDSVFRVLHNGIEVGTHARKNASKRIRHMRATTRGG